MIDVRRITRAGAFSAPSALTALLLIAASASAAPSWGIYSQSNPTAVPGGEVEYTVTVRAIGGDIPATIGGNGENCTPGAPSPADHSKCYTITATFPEGVTPITTGGSSGEAFLAETCTTDFSSNSITCLVSGSQNNSLGTQQLFSTPDPQGIRLDGGRGRTFGAFIAEVSPTANGTLPVEFQVSGGGAMTARIIDTTRVTPAPPGFEIGKFDGLVKDASAGVFTQAAGTPYSVTNDFEFTSFKNLDLPASDDPGIQNYWPTASARDVIVDLPPGLIGNPTKLGRCKADQLAITPGGSVYGFETLCPPTAQVGTVWIRTGGNSRAGLIGPIPVFNMVPPSGAPARFSFKILGTVVNIDASLRFDSDYGISLGTKGTPQALAFQGANFDFWGVPFDEAHFAERLCPGFEGIYKTCSANAEPTPFIRQPTACPNPGEGLQWRIQADSYENPGSFEEAHFESHDPPGYPLAPEEWGDFQGPTGCDIVPAKGKLDVQPTNKDAETPTGLNVRVEVPNPGLDNAEGIASSDIRKVKVALPEGVTINPSQGSGLGACTLAQYASEELAFFPKAGTGCPGDSKIGTVITKSPLLDEFLEGSVYVAKPFDNPFDSLIALYIVIKNPERGVMVKLAGKVEPNPVTGQIVTTFDDIPQVPFSWFDLKFREGVRSPLSTPRACGTYTTTAEFTPHSDPSKTITDKSSFQITRGVGGAPCPVGTAPFSPKLQAGSLNNNALSFSPFTVRMIREDGEQEITRFSANLPPGLAAKLAGIPKCSEGDLRATALAPGRATIDGSICPAASQVGRVTVGYGVGSVQTFATGKVFLAGPYQGAPVSVATVAPAVVGPFDLGTVVQRSAFTVHPETAEVRLDSRASDPIPHILKGVELHLRDIRVYMDRPNFTFNPTSCDRTQVGAFLNGSGADFTTPADDSLIDVSNPFQAANCALLPFKPKLSFRLKGGTRRGAFPALTATLKARPGDANLGKAVVALPKSAFLEQSHIGTVCTRVQFAEAKCPKESIYGVATATTPLLDEPLKGNAYLRSSNNELPDLVLALRGEIAVDAVGRIDSVNGGIRTTFDTIPDTPLDTFTLRMQGGKKGLFVNSRNLCLRPARADVRFIGQNGKIARSRPKMQVRCGKRRGKRAKR